MAIDKGFWLTCLDCKFRINDIKTNDCPCEKSHEEVKKSISYDNNGDTICELKETDGKEMPEIENDDRKIWNCECGWSNCGSRNICDKCKEPRVHPFNKKEHTEDITEQTYKISECVSHSAIKIQELEKEKAKMKFYDSLLNAVQQAGGSTSWIKEDTTLKELCDSLATNNIRFIHNSAALSKEPSMSEFQKKMFGG